MGFSLPVRLKVVNFFIPIICHRNSQVDPIISCTDHYYHRARLGYAKENLYTDRCPDTISILQPASFFGLAVVHRTTCILAARRPRQQREMKSIEKLRLQSLRRSSSPTLRWLLCWSGNAARYRTRKRRFDVM